MTSFPAVTIVTPSLNQGRFIRETIESVLSQDYPSIEYVVVDGGSTDETISILRQYGSRVAWTSERDGGQAHAINKGWRESKGEILAWINSDDLYATGAVTKAVQFLIDYPQIGMVYGEAENIDEAGRAIKRYPTEVFDPRRLMETCIVCQPTAFMRRSVIEDVGYLDESLNFSMDYDLWIRIAKKYPLGYLPECFAKSRLYVDTKTLRDRAAVYKETVAMISGHYGFAPASWICGYAYRTLEARFNRRVWWQNAAFLISLAGLSAWNCFRYNKRMPLFEVKPWVRGLREGFMKLKNEEASPTQRDRASANMIEH